VYESRAVVEQATEPLAAALWQRIDEAWATVLESPDAAEGARAFAERRAPRWAD
jgi:enoyl-CoA hydratase/carnithine racemase